MYSKLSTFCPRVCAGVGRSSKRQYSVLRDERAFTGTLSLVYNQDRIHVVDKPVGLPSTGRALNDTFCVQWQLQKLLRRPVWAIHQLDRDTTGVNIFVSARSLVKTWQQHLAAEESFKTYIGVVAGEPSFDKLTVSAPLRWSKTNHRRVVVADDGKAAVTKIRVLSRARGCALVAAQPLTGRTHQLRVHFAHIGHPLLGELRYVGRVEEALEGKESLESDENPNTEHSRCSLHCWRIDLCPDAPTDVFQADFPEDLKRLCADRKLHLPEELLRG